MTTSSNNSPAASPARGPMRLTLGQAVGHAAAPGADGAWWPRSRDLNVEAADLVDHFPLETGRINRLTFSRPDWDDPVVEGRGVRKIRAARGPVKTGSFPHDDTHLMIVTLASGRRLKLVVIPSATEHTEAERLLESAGADALPSA